MNGRKYQAFMAPAAYRKYKKFDPLLQEKIKEETRKLSEDPYLYEGLKGPLRGIWSYHFGITKHNIGLLIEFLKTKNKLRWSW